MRTFHLLLTLLSLVSGEGDGSNYQLLSLVDRTNPQGPHFYPGYQPSAKSYQVQWRPSFYSRFSTFENSLHQTGAESRIQYQLQINGHQPQLQQQQPQQQNIFPAKKPSLVNQALTKSQAPAPKQTRPISKSGPSRFNDITSGGSGLFEKLTDSKHRDASGTFFKYDYHPEEKLAMASLDYV